MLQEGKRKSSSVLVVDDDPFLLSSISSLLQEYGYPVVACDNVREAIEKFEEHSFDAVLADIKMPLVSGMEFLERIRAESPDVPVILMTAYANLDTAVDAIKKGAFDFIMKPYRGAQLVHSIEKAVRYNALMKMEKEYKLKLEDTVRRKTTELASALDMVNSMSRELVERLTAVAEYKDTETALHNRRIGLYATVLSEELGMPAEFVQSVKFAGPMHDIGKIGIPDDILYKPAALKPAEFEIIRSHTVIGERILSGSSNPNIRMAASIAASHHERWDGTGYPKGLKREDIPLEGRIVMICDQYDALMSKRPYKPSYDHEMTLSIITRGDSRTMPGHFDPRVLDAFVRVAPVFKEVFHSKAGRQDA